MPSILNQQQLPKIMARERGFTYRTTDPVQNLQLRVSVRQIQAGSSSGCGSSLKQPDRQATVSQTIKWQQKVFAPWELAKYSYFCKGHVQGEGKHPREYIRRIRTTDSAERDRCLADFDHHGFYIYTCVSQFALQKHTSARAFVSGLIVR